VARSKSSSRWLKEHFDDPWVKKAQQDGFRSRASYKLLEIQAKDRILRPGLCVLDLGAAPGGWSQVASRVIGSSGLLIASDILPMASLPDVEFIQGDFTEEAVFNQLLDVLDSRAVDLVLSDMAPNLSGVRAADQPRAMYLCELSLDFAAKVLRPGGDMLLKVFQGEGFDEFLRQVRGEFEQVLMRKPLPSRSRSREQYLLARGKR